MAGIGYFLRVLGWLALVFLAVDLFLELFVGVDQMQIHFSTGQFVLVGVLAVLGVTVGGWLEERGQRA